MEPLGRAAEKKLLRHRDEVLDQPEVEALHQEHLTVFSAGVAGAYKAGRRERTVNAVATR